MKKSLFLLPLLAGFSMAGCYVDLGFVKFGTPETNDKTETGNKTDTNTGGDTGGGQSTIKVEGTPLATITMSQCQDMKSDGVFEKNGYTVTVSQNTCKQTVSDAVANSQKFEFRVYAYMTMSFEGTSAFSKLLVTYSTYAGNNSTYYFDFEELDGATNAHDDVAGKALITLDSASTSFDVLCWHQTRIASVAFYA